MRLTDVAWTRDRQGRPVLELKIDGHSAYIRGSQQTELTRRDIVDGVVFLNSERGNQLPNVYIHRDHASAYQGVDRPYAQVSDQHPDVIVQKRRREWLAAPDMTRLVAGTP
jgi:hypothetical protein